MRAFIKDGEETDRLRAGTRETGASGRRLYTDAKTGDQWQDFCAGIIPQTLFWTGLVRFPRPDTEQLFALCRESEDLA